MTITPSGKSLDDRVHGLIEAVLERLVSRFDLPEEITELPRPRKTTEERARGFQTTLEDLMREAGGELMGLRLHEQHGGHHKLDEFASVTGRGGLREFDVTLLDLGSQEIVLIELKWSSLKKSPSGVIFEQAWDAVKCALARVQYGGSQRRADTDGEPVIRAYIVCGARKSSWQETSVGDIFGHPPQGEETGAAISVAELWERTVLRTDPKVKGPGGGFTVGCDLHRGSANARIKSSPHLVVDAHREVRSKFRGTKDLWLTRISAIEPATHDRAQWSRPVPHSATDGSEVCEDPRCAVSW